MATQRAGWSALMLKDLNKVYVEVGKERPREYPLVFNVEEMDTNPIKNRQVAGLGTMPRKPEGTGFVRDEPLLGPGKEYEAEPFGLSLEFSWELWRDELYGIMRLMTKELGRSGRHREEVQAWSILNNAFDNNFPGFDGVSLVHIAHPGLDGVTRGNRPSPDVGFSQTAIQAALLNYENQTNERGLPLLHNPAMLIINAANKFVAREILGSSNKPYTADNEINALMSEDLTWMVSHYLTSLTGWFLASSKANHDMSFYWRDHPIFDNWDDPDTKNAIFSSYQRHTQGFGSWRGVFGSTG